VLESSFGVLRLGSSNEISSGRGGASAGGARDAVQDYPEKSSLIIPRRAENVENPYESSMDLRGSFLAITVRRRGSQILPSPDLSRPTLFPISKTFVSVRVHSRFLTSQFASIRGLGFLGACKS
jgi:hypothetical protein